jgi:hypothetical protein
MLAQMKTAAPTIVKGINVDALFARASEATPRRARYTDASLRSGRVRHGVA